MIMEHKMKHLILILAIGLSSCSSVAELERPEDTTVVRASCTRAVPIVAWLTGGTDVAQITILDRTVTETQRVNAGNLALIEDYEVELRVGDCHIGLRPQYGETID